MDVQTAYDLWSVQYDKDVNKTRDLEAVALRQILKGFNFGNCLEIGCGTGKNTEFYLSNAGHVTAVDLSAEMLAKAKQKIQSDKVCFTQANILKPWDFATEKYDLISFSLVLEHIESLDHIFKEASEVLLPGGYLYIGELHPFKQYVGSKARFQTEEGLQVLPCFTHHISDFIQAGKHSGMQAVEVKEYFDEDARNGIPRILAIVFRKL